MAPYYDAAVEVFASRTTPLKVQAGWRGNGIGVRVFMTATGLAQSGRPAQAGIRIVFRLGRSFIAIDRWWSSTVVGKLVVNALGGLWGVVVKTDVIRRAVVLNSEP